MPTAKEFVAVAAQYVGYLEKATNAQLDSKTANAGHANYNRFARDLKKRSAWSWLYQGAAWCCEFVSACTAETCGWDVAKTQKLLGGSAEMSCNRLWNQMKKAGKKCGRRADMTPQVGDFIFFQSGGSINHIGLVEKVDASRVYTIEGNSSDKVQRKNYSRSYERIYGYARPGWDAEQPDTTPKQTFKNLRAVDLSSWDETSHKAHTDNVLASKNCGIVIVKFTGGTDYKNPYRQQQYDRAKAGGKLLGTYHYAKGRDPKKEAAAYYNAVKATIGEAVPFLDWESIDNPAFEWKLAKRREWVKEFADEFERLSGVRPGGYVQLSRIGDVDGLVPILWGAGYPVGGWDKWTLPTYTYSKLFDKAKLQLWQYTSAGGTDRSVCYMTAAEWKAAAKAAKPKKRTYKVTAKPCLNVRKGAGTNYAVCTSKRYGDEFSSSTFATDKQGREWAKVNAGWLCLGKSGKWYVKRLK